MVVTTRAISRAKLQSNHHQQTNTQFIYRPDALNDDDNDDDDNNNNNNTVIYTNVNKNIVYLQLMTAN